MHIISLYLVLHACAATFDVMCVKKIKATKRGLRVFLIISRSSGLPCPIIKMQILWDGGSTSNEKKREKKDEVYGWDKRLGTIYTMASPHICLREPSNAFRWINKGFVTIFAQIGIYSPRY
jgi:hypothetical protein